MNAKQQFIDWVKTNDPFLYQVALKKYSLESGETLSGFSDFFSSLTDTVTKIAPKLMELSSQKKILDTQLKRAQANLPPLNTQEYRPVVPTGGTQLEIEQIRAANQIALENARGAANTAKNGMLLAVAGALAFMFLKGRR